MKVELVIFDLDGVLVDTEPLYIDISRKLFSKLGINIPLHDHYKFVGISPWKMWHEIQTQFNIDETVEYLVSMEKQEQYLRLKQDNHLMSINGTVDLLRQIKGLCIPMSLASSSNHKIIDLITTILNIRYFFDLIVSGDDVIEGKPAPDIYYKVADLMMVRPERCIVIEDSINGITSAKSAGMYCIGYNNPSATQDVSSADLVINDFSPDSRATILELLRD